MGERERIDVLKYVYSYTCARAGILILCKVYGWWSPNHTPIFSAIRPAIPEIRKRGAHVHVYPTISLPSFVKSLANVSLCETLS